MWPRMQEEPVGEVVSRVVDDGKAYVRAELDLVKAVVRARVAALWPALAMLVAALLILQAALTVLLAALGLALARWLGAAGGLATGGVIGLLVIGVLVGIAVGRLKRAFG